MLHPAIRTFLTVARCGSFSAAAEQLYLSKVSVMNQMNALEAELGVPLFTRTRRGAALTEAGRSFRKNAEALAALAAKGLLRWEDLEGQTLLLLRAGASPEIDAIRRAAARRPGIAILDFDGYYDVSVFNRCAQSGWLMEIPALWTGIHPDLVTRRVRWPYRLPFGLMHQADPPAPVRDFLDGMRRRAAARPFRLPR